MKTTVDIDDRLFKEAKKRALSSGVTFRTVLEDALRAYLLPTSIPPAPPFRLDLPVIQGSQAAQVDLSDRGATLAYMERPK